MSNAKNYLTHLLVLCFIQIVVLDNIHLSSYLHVNIYIMAIFLLPYRLKGVPLLLYAFFLGLLMDLAGSTAGIHAAAATLLAYIRPRLLHLTAIREDMDDARGFLHKVDFAWFFKYVSLSTLLFNIVFILAEAFTLGNLLLSALRIISSALVSLLFILLYYFVGLKKVRR